MIYKKEELLKHINKIRKEIGHDEVDIKLQEIIFNEENNEMWIIAIDRPDKSAIIGKGGWVVGRLREELKLNTIHVESYSDFLLKKYRMQLSLEKIKSFIKEFEKDNRKNEEVIPLKNLKYILEEKIANVYSFNFKNHFQKNKYKESKKPIAIVGLSGGTDSSFSLIIAKKLGFNPIAISIDPGTIVLPKQFKENINKLCKDLKVKHKYISTDYSEIIKESFTGRFHPCGRCSSVIEETIYDYSIKHEIPIVIFGDMLATGSQCINYQKHKNTEIIRLNLPATLSVAKLENKSLTNSYDLNKIKGFGCPLLYEVHKKFPYMKKYSIQRILRETRGGALEPGEALDLIWSFYNTK